MEVNQWEKKQQLDNNYIGNNFTENSNSFSNFVPIRFK